MLFSNTHFTIGVHVLTALAANRGEVVPSARLAESVDTNPAFLRLVLGQLKEAGLVATKLGKGGGSFLARGSETIRLTDVFRATEGKAELQAHRCEGDGHCHVAKSMAGFFDELSGRLDGAIERELDRMTIADLLRRAESKTNPTPGA